MCRTTCSTMVFFVGCRGISALAPGSPPLPPSSLTLVSAGLFLTLLFPHSSLTHLTTYYFYPLITFSQRCHQFSWWASCVLRCVCCGAVWNQLCLWWGSPWSLLAEAPMSSPCCQSLSTYTQYNHIAYTLYFLPSKMLRKINKSQNDLAKLHCAWTSTWNDFMISLPKTYYLSSGNNDKITIFFAYLSVTVETKFSVSFLCAFFWYSTLLCM